MTYWEQRAADAAARQDAAIARALPELASALQEARRELQKEIEAFWSRYAKNNAVSLADAQKALSLEELADFKGDLKSFRRLAKRSIGTFSLEVENLSVKARITRLEALQAQCGAILQRCYQRQREAIEAAAQGLAVEQYDHALYDIEQYTGFQSAYAQLSTRAIRQMLAMPVQGSDLSTALWRQDMDAGFQIRRMLGLMFTTGKPPQDFAKEMQRIIGRRDAEGNLTGKTYEAYRLLYNESAHVSEQAKLAAYEEDGIEELEIVTTLDSKTCGDCGPRDGKRVKVKDAVEGVNIPPFHVNCRCTTAPYVAAAQGSFTRTRAARDPVTGKTVRVKAQTFEEWKKERAGKASGKAGDTDGDTVIDSVKPIDFSDEKEVNKVIRRFGEDFSYAPIEHGVVISPMGKVFEMTGHKSGVNTDLAGDDALIGSIVIHNHPVPRGESFYDSFSLQDIETAARTRSKMEVLFSGDRKHVMMLTREFSEKEVYNEYTAAFNRVRLKAVAERREIVYEQLEIMQELGRTVEGVVFHEL